jgi:hypothetical protein
MGSPQEPDRGPGEPWRVIASSVCGCLSIYRDFAVAGDLPHLVAKYAPRTDQPARGQLAFRSWEPSQIDAVASRRPCCTSARSPR